MKCVTFIEGIEEPIFFPDVETAKLACLELRVNFFLPFPDDARKEPETCFWFQDGSWVEKTEKQFRDEGLCCCSSCKGSFKNSVR